MKLLASEYIYVWFVTKGTDYCSCILGDHTLVIWAVVVEVTIAGQIDMPGPD